MSSVTSLTKLKDARFCILFQEILRQREAIVDQTANLLSSLKIGGQSVQVSSVEELEWKFGSGLAGRGFPGANPEKSGASATDPGNASDPEVLKVLNEGDVPHKSGILMTENGAEEKVNKKSLKFFRVS